MEAGDLGVGGFGEVGKGRGEGRRWRWSGEKVDREREGEEEGVAEGPEGVVPLSCEIR